MTTTAAQPAPARAPTPRPKPSRTSTPPSESTAAPKSRSIHSSTTTESSAPSQLPAGPRRGARAASTDPLSDKATAFLIRRILCPQQADKGKSSPASIEGLLPPLTSRNDVDLQLYALIAIILRDFVQAWYAKITPDETFVAEIVQIIAHITRALEQRLRKVDLESLLFDELPDLLDKHVTAYRVAHDPLTPPPVRTDPREIYHSLCPLPALSPVPRPEDPESVAAQAENEAAYRQLLAYAFLAILLPTEDLENGCLTTLVGQIFSELIIGNAVANRLSEPWLIWELLIIVSRTAGRRKGAESEQRLEDASNGPSLGRRGVSLQALFWTIMQWCFLAFSFIRGTFAVLIASASLPPRASHGTSIEDANRHAPGQGSIPRTRPTKTDSQPPKTPTLALRCWSAVSNLAELDIRMPWLYGALSMLQWIAITGPGRIAGFNGKLDRLISYGIHRYVLDAANLPPLLRTVRGVLFPNNMPAGKPTLVPPSSEAELRALRRRCASALWALVPKGVGRLYFGGGLLRASPVLRARQDKTEGSAELKAGKSERQQRKQQQDDSDRDRGPASDEKEASGIEKTVPPPPPLSAKTAKARGQERSSSSSGSRSLRSAPVPRPNTGGQQQGLSAAAAVANISADDRPPTPQPLLSPNNNKAASTSEEVNGGMASMQGNEKGWRQDPRDRDHDQGCDDEEILEEIERGILDVFSDAYCNKHLVYGMLELILVRLLPELTEKGVLELWAERIPVVDGEQ